MLIRYAGPIFGSISSQGCLSYSSSGIWLNHYTMSVWKSEEDMKKFFDEIDTDGSGQIKRVEIKKFLISMGTPLTDEEFNAKLDHMEKSRNDKISFREFKDTFR